MKTDYQIGMLWISGRLSFLEQLCVKSFLDAGHHVKLYTYEPVEGIPDGVEHADASQVLPLTNYVTHKRTGSPAPHSDVFSYEMLNQNDQMIWADTDAYCVKPFATDNGHFYGWESEKHINVGVLGLPRGCDTLNELLAFTKDEYAIPSWYGEKYVRELEAARDAGNPVHVGEQPWGVWGPHALTHFLHKTGEHRHALPVEGLYPFSFKQRRLMLKPNFDVSSRITDDTYSIHFYGRRMRARIYEREGGEPHPDSLLGRLIKLHGIVPSDSPLPRPKTHTADPDASDKPDTSDKIVRQGAAISPLAAEPLRPEDKRGRGLLNLTDLADSYGFDRGSAKHRFTELYNMLFQPFRNRKITLLELGQHTDISSPESAQSQPTPSAQMWLDYFLKAEIIGMDSADLSGFKAERFRFVQCDMDKRETIARAAEISEKFDIIIDDASHASHHQQNAFLELFPKLASGGLYVVEDLRWQPKEMEVDGYPKTADLFQGLLYNGVFTHSDAGFADDLNALRADMSGTFIFQAKYQKKNRDQMVVIHKR